MFTTQPVIFFDETTSTNDVASNYIANDDATDGTLIITNFQTKGRGQRGNKWQSTKGKNLLMSLILKPDWLNVREVFLLNMCIALGVYDYIALKTDVHVNIKWPNDILCGTKKVAGILIENTFRSNNLSWCIAGVGVNLNQQKFDGTLNNATSLQILSGLAFSPEEEALELRGKIFYWYETLKSNNATAIKETYHQRLFGLDERRNFKFKEDFIQGYIRGVDNSGRLVVEKADGEIIFPDIKEIEYVFN
jgi:BirA family biotin operon repressor/biotin-[acetyl-CoA-carboxylase] ligase